MNGWEQELRLRAAVIRAAAKVKRGGKIRREPLPPGCLVKRMDCWAAFKPLHLTRTQRKPLVAQRKKEAEQLRARKAAQQEANAEAKRERQNREQQDVIARWVTYNRRVAAGQRLFKTWTRALEVGVPDCLLDAEHYRLEIKRLIQEQTK